LGLEPQDPLLFCAKNVERKRNMQMRKNWGDEKNTDSNRRRSFENTTQKKYKLAWRIRPRIGSSLLSCGG